MLARFLSWIKSETALATAETWAPPAFHPCSSEDPRCAETIRKLAECRERMRRVRSGLLDDPNRKFSNSAGTDVAATIRRAMAVGYGPVRAVTQRRAGR